MLTFEVFQRDEAGTLYDWRAKAKNGQIVATSGGQGYTRPGRAFTALWKLLDAIENPTEANDWWVNQVVVRPAAPVEDGPRALVKVGKPQGSPHTDLPAPKARVTRTKPAKRG